jgi:hypothetical protein
MAIFVRTAGLGTGRQKLELLAADDVALILPQERRILARTRVPFAAALGGKVRRALKRELRRFFARRRPPNGFCRP